MRGMSACMLRRRSRSARNLDLTPALMQVIGWQLETLKFGTCDTGVANALDDGDLLHVKYQACDGALA